MTTWGQPRANQRLSGQPSRLTRVDPRRERERTRFSPISSHEDIEWALALVPSALCVMSAAHEQKRTGMLVSRIMRASDERPSIAVSVPTGQRLTMLIRDSRAFGLSFIDRSQRGLLRRFGSESGGELPSGVCDPFDTQPTRTLVTGAPLLAKAIFSLDCEVVRHFDLESDYEIYVGVVLGTVVETTIVQAAGLEQLTPPAPHARPA
jgi:flavin reductase (DIM6/NTAB) family NADH-FMN oxidoreductase RutF